jgi:hypothetical protein
MNNKIKYCLLLFTACQSTPSQTGTDSPFYFPKSPPETDWCAGGLDEAVPLFPDTGDSLRLFFIRHAGVYRLLAKVGNSTSACLLKIDQEGRIGVYTADQLPTCAARREGFNIGSTGNLHYENDRQLGFDLQADSSAYGPAIFVSPKSNHAMGFNLYRCNNCR